MSSSRPTRKCKKSNVTKRPSTSLYLGYVDDNETVEMITQKFALLEDFVKSHSKEANNSVPLTEEEMEQVFNITSTFSLSELNYGAGYLDEYEPSDSEKEDSDLVDYEKESDFFADYSFSDESFSNSSDDIGYFSKSNRNNSKKKEYSDINKTDLLETERYTNSNNDDIINFDEDYIDTLEDKEYLMKRKKKPRQLDPYAPQLIRLPPQIPMNRRMARIISPFTGHNEYPFIPDSLHIETDIISFDLTTLGQKFVGVLMDVPWLLPHHSITTHRVTTEDLYKLRIDKIVNNGLIFVWVEKEVISACVKLFSKWGFSYVENLVWIKQNIDLKISEQPYHIFNKSKASLLIFRKGDKLNLRHQRNPDVIFDIIKSGKYLTEDKPLSVYKIIETILPESNYKNKEKGRFLELWCKKGYRRKGWVTIAQSAY